MDKGNPAINRRGKGLSEVRAAKRHGRLGGPAVPSDAPEQIASGQQFGLRLELNWLRLLASYYLLDLFLPLRVRQWFEG